MIAEAHWQNMIISKTYGAELVFQIKSSLIIIQPYFMYLNI